MLTPKISLIMKIRTDAPLWFAMNCCVHTKAIVSKRLWLLSLFLLCGSFASAQDVIVKKDGTTIESRVIEVGETSVKYKKYSKPNGPTYTIPVTDLRTIYYEDGGKDGQFFPQSDVYAKDDYSQPETVTSNNYSDRSTTSSKTLSPYDYCFYGLTYIADFDYIDKGVYGFAGHVFGSTGFGVSFDFGWNFEYNIFQCKIGPNYCLPLSEHAFFYTPLQAVLNWQSFEGEDDNEFSWGAQLTPSMGLKFGKFIFAAGVAFSWAEGSDKIGTGFNVNLSWAL